MHGLATNAYRASAARRTQKEQDAEVFRRANVALRRAVDADGVTKARAIADNSLLWTAVVDLLRDPANPLPPALKGSIISVGLTVQREMAARAPDFGFLIGINDQIAAGLGGTSVGGS